MSVPLGQDGAVHPRPAMAQPYPGGLMSSKKFQELRWKFWIPGPSLVPVKVLEPRPLRILDLRTPEFQNQELVRMPEPLLECQSPNLPALGPWKPGSVQQIWGGNRGSVHREGGVFPQGPHRTDSGLRTVSTVSCRGGPAMPLANFGGQRRPCQGSLRAWPACLGNLRWQLSPEPVGGRGEWKPPAVPRESHASFQPPPRPRALGHRFVPRQGRREAVSGYVAPRRMRSA